MILEYSSFSKTFVTSAPGAHEPLAQCLGGYVLYVFREASGRSVLGTFNPVGQFLGGWLMPAKEAHQESGRTVPMACLAARIL